MVGRAVLRVVKILLVLAGGISVFPGISNSDTGESGATRKIDKTQSGREADKNQSKPTDTQLMGKILITGSSRKRRNTMNYRSRRDYEKRRARITPYKGPSLGLPQIYTRARKRKSVHPELKASSFKQLIRTRSSHIFSKQVLVYRQRVNSPYYNLKVRKKEHICAKPYSNAVDEEQYALLNGLPVVVWLNENNKKTLEYDPRDYLYKKPTSEKPDYGIVVETAPDDLEIGVEVEFH